MVNLLSLDGITQEPHDFNRVERQYEQRGQHIEKSHISSIRKDIANLSDQLWRLKKSANRIIDSTWQKVYIAS